MDPDAALRMIDDADRVDAETREVMRGLHQWLSRGGFEPDWKAYPTGTRRYRKAYGRSRPANASVRSRAARSHGGRTRSHATVRAFSSSGAQPIRSMGGLQIGDIVQRADGVSKNRYVVTDIRAPWIYSRRISGSGQPGIITFPSSSMLRKVG